MKKLTVLVMALVMLLSFAMAETAEISTVNFTEMIPEELLAAGTYDTLNEDIPAKIWVPNGMFTVADATEIPEEYATGLEIGMFSYIRFQIFSFFFIAKKA